MLVLNRKVGEKICIDGQIVITVNRIQGRRVSLTIQAPKDIHVVRGELRPFVCELSPDAPTSPDLLVMHPDHAAVQRPPATA
jgi:carbon storage regulator CsrA